MAKQKTKSINDLYNQFIRIQSLAQEGLAQGRYNSRQYDTRKETASRLEAKYAHNISQTPSYQNTVKRMDKANAHLTGMSLIEADKPYIEKNDARQYSRSTYMGGVRRASGGKG